MVNQYCAHSLARNWQLSFLNQRTGENDCRDISWSISTKIRSPSPNSNQFFVMSELHIHANLVRIQPLVHKILCRQESVTTTRSIPKTRCLLTSGEGEGHRYIPITWTLWGHNVFLTWGVGWGGGGAYKQHTSLKILRHFIFVFGWLHSWIFWFIWQK